MSIHANPKQKGEMIYIGIDVGLSGAIAAIDERHRIILLRDAPILTVTNGRKNYREYQVSGMVMDIKNIPTMENERIMAFIEKVHSMPEQGVRSVFSLGHGLGLWEGIIAALGIPVTLVLPQRWKKVMLDGMGKDKDAARYRAMQLFPGADLKLKKDHGKAEALLIAAYGERLE